MCFNIIGNRYLLHNLPILIAMYKFGNKKKYLHFVSNFDFYPFVISGKPLAACQGSIKIFL